MKRFEYSAEDIEGILAALRRSGQASELDLGVLIWRLEMACDNFLTSVEYARRNEDPSRRRKGKAFETVIENVEIDAESYSAMLSMQEQLIADGIPPFKALASMVISDKIAVWDFEQFVVLTYLKRKAEYLQGKSVEESYKAQAFKKPKEDLFFEIFRLWAELFSEPWHQVTISDPEETPAQTFIHAATHAVIARADLKHPGGRTVANTIRDARKRGKSAKEEC